MTRVFLVGLLVLVTGCHKEEKRDIELTLNTSFASGASVLACKSSSSGTCNAVFVTGPTRATLSAEPGKTATQSGISAATVFCVDVHAPDPAKCGPQPLTDGEQIVRSHSVASK